jgi:tRNA/rRNA methyltransferase
MKRIVLVRPRGPRNVGSALRAATNFGPAELVLVAPQRPAVLVHPEFEQMAHGVPDAARRVRVVPTLEQALADTTRSVGFTARVRRHRIVQPFDERSGELIEWCEAPDERVALVFGSEEDGLSADETDHCQELCYLPCSSEHGSLNLSMAVTVVLYALFPREGARAKRSRGAPLDARQRAYLIAHVGEALASVARSEAAGQHIAESVARVFARAPVETRDARAWHQIMRALGNHKEPHDYGL